MDILFIALLAVTTFYLVKKINEKTGMAQAILYIIVGLIIGAVVRGQGIEGLSVLLPHIDKYGNFLLLLMFFSAGFSINTDAILKSGSTVPKLSFIPSSVETILVGTILYFLVGQFGGAIGLHLNFFESLVISGILALSSTANVIPYCIDLIQGKYKSKNNMQNTMVAVSVTDGFSTLPLIMLALFLSIEKYNGTEFTAKTVVVITIGVIIALILSGILGFFIGRAVDIISKPVMKYLHDHSDDKPKAVAISIGVFLLSYALIMLCAELPKVGGAISSLSVLIICAVGAGVNHFDKTDASKTVSKVGNTLFAMFGTPIIFLSVGSKLQLKTLLNPNMLIIGISACLIGVVIKGSVSALLLDKEKFTNDERKFVASCFVPKGLTLVNFSVIFAGLAHKYHAENIVNFMIMLAGITIIITVPIGVTLLSKAKDKWFTKES